MYVKTKPKETKDKASQWNMELLRLFDRERILSVLRSANVGFAFYEILKFPGLLKDSVLDREFATMAGLTSTTLTVGQHLADPRQLPGFYALLLSPDEHITKWCRDRIKQLGKISDVGIVPALLPVLTDIFENFEKEVFREAVLGTYFPDLVNQIFEHFLRPDRQELVQALRTFWSLVKLLDVHLWFHSTHSPSFVIENVIAATMRLADEDDAHTRACFLLLAEILKSLESMEGEELAKQTDTVCKLLLGAMQNQRHSREISEAAAQLALKIVGRRYSSGEMGAPVQVPWANYLHLLGRKEGTFLEDVMTLESLSLRSKCLAALGKETANSSKLIWTRAFWGFIFSTPPPNEAYFASTLTSFKCLGIVELKDGELANSLAWYSNKMNSYLTKTTAGVFHSKKCLKSQSTLQAFVFLLASPVRQAAVQFLSGVTGVDAPTKSLAAVSQPSWIFESILSLLTEIKTLSTPNCFGSLGGLYQHCVRLFLGAVATKDGETADRDQILELLWKLTLHLIKKHSAFDSTITAAFRAFTDLWSLWLSTQFLEIAASIDSWIVDFFRWYKGYSPQLFQAWYEALMKMLYSVPKGTLSKHPVFKVGLSSMLQKADLDPDKRSRLTRAYTDALGEEKLAALRRPNQLPDCVHGYHCAVRKLEHFSEFNHPEELLRKLPPSYRNLNKGLKLQPQPTSEPPFCQFGLNCKRTDPKHLLENRHPVGFKPSLMSPDFPREQPRKPAGPIQLISTPPASRPVLRDPQQALADTQRASLADMLKKVLAWTPESLRLSSRLAEVPKTFEAMKAYVDVFQPLLLEELKAQLLQEESRPTAKAIAKEIRREDDFHFVEMEGDVAALEGFTDGDLVQVTNAKDPKAMCFGRYETEDVEKGFRVRLYLANGQKLISAGAKAVQAMLKIDSRWTVQRLGSLITTIREYEALASCRHIPLAAQIMHPTTASVFTTQPFRIPQPLQETFRGEFNPSQVKAIESATNTKGFSLIQGPPGTGKTRTILGIISAFLAAPPDLQPRYEMLNGKAVNRSKKMQILVCAPSNAAVDETVLRISRGLWNAHGQALVPQVVRHGLSTNPAVEPYTLDSQVEKRLRGVQEADREKLNEFDSKWQDIAKKVAALNESIGEWHEKRETAREQLNAAEEAKAQAELTRLHAEKKQLNGRRDQVKTDRAGISEHLAGSRRRLSLQILAEASIICTTLSGSGHKLFKEMQFPTVVIDEAAQAVEVSTLIPLCHGATRVILIGDPNQLPATVLSRNAQNSSYQQSLFERLHLCGVRMHMLDIQYRMNPLISTFPSRYFYEGKLKDGPDTGQVQPYHADQRFRALTAFNVDGREQSYASSVRNPEEAAALAATLAHLLREFPTVLPQSVGVISPYKAQVRELRRHLKERLGEEVAARLTVNTVDGFQGAERDVIFFSCVRASASGTIGFLADTRRMNVGLTRARYLLAVFGNRDALAVNVTWKAFFDFAATSDRLLDYTASRLPPAGPAKKADKPPTPEPGELSPEPGKRKAAASDQPAKKLKASVSQLLDAPGAAEKSARQAQTHPRAALPPDLIALSPKPTPKPLTKSVPLPLAKNTPLVKTAPPEPKPEPQPQPTALTKAPTLIKPPVLKKSVPLPLTKTVQPFTKTAPSPRPEPPEHDRPELPASPSKKLRDTEEATNTFLLAPRIKPAPKPRPERPQIILLEDS